MFSQQNPARHENIHKDVFQIALWLSRANVPDAVKIPSWILRSVTLAAARADVMILKPGYIAAPRTFRTVRKYEDFGARGRYLRQG